jgi:hypothetical protein
MAKELADMLRDGSLKSNQFGLDPNHPKNRHLPPDHPAFRKSQPKP